jgi:poly(beta-D-mannuronate) lyase
MIGNTRIRSWFSIGLCLLLVTALMPLLGPASTAEAATTVTVSTSAQLQAEINSATAGKTIILANGTYSQSGEFTINGKNGSSGNEIVIKAQNRGQAVISGGAWFNISNSSYITISGLKFTTTTTSSNYAIKIDGSSRVRVTRNVFDLNETGATTKWINIRGTNSNNNRIDRNEFKNKSDPGPVISVDGNGSTYMSQYTIIDRNYFYNIGPRISNGLETIRLGLSGVSLLDGHSTVEYNLFENADGDPEIISVKSGSNTIRYNTVRNSQGQITARHGNKNSFYGNFIIGNGSKSGVGGFRIYGTDHKLYNNYLEKLTDSAILIDGGDWDGGPNSTNYDSSKLTMHWRVYRAEVVNNTIVSSNSGVVIGKGYTYAPVDSKVANNIVKNTTGTLYNEVKTSNTLFQGNIGHGSTLTNKSRTSSEIRNVDPAFQTVSSLQKLKSSSPAINAAVGSYSYVTDDMDGQTRSVNDVGADEYSTASIVRSPLTTSDVGPNAP